MTTCEPLPDGGFRLWPTPQAHDMHPGNPARVGRYGTKHGARNLNDEVALAELGPLPQPTPDDPQLTLFAEDSPASPSASPARASRRRIAGGSGRRSRASFATYDPATSSWRTSRVSLDGEWETYSETWPRSGTTRNGTAFLRPSSVPPIYASGSGLWPTPCAHEDGKTPEAHLAMKARMPGGPRKTITSLNVMVKAVERQLMPTPTANRWDGLQSHGVNVVTGQLNPTWVELLMGYPPGWTDLDD